MNDTGPDSRRQLTARFEVNLPRLRVRGPEPRSYRLVIDSFNVTITLQPEHHESHRRTGETTGTHMCQVGAVVVTREEPQPPPPIGRLASGHRDMGPRAEYFGRLDEYRRVAGVVANRLASFMRYGLRQSGRGAASIGGNPTWTDGTGNELETGHFEIVGTFESVGELSERVFEPDDEEALAAALTVDPKPELHEVFLSQAQTAASLGQHERAVMELAIACEVFAKHRAFQGATRSARVFEALEDRRRAQVRVPDLIDLIGRTSSAAQTFTKAHKDAAVDVDHLFRARNKVAHRGEAVFRDDTDQIHRVTDVLLKKWWTSIDIMIQWVDSLPD